MLSDWPSLSASYIRSFSPVRISTRSRKLWGPASIGSS